MRYEVKFVKYQGCGNDFALKDELEGPVTPDQDRGKLAKVLCDRHFQVGADGVLFLESAKGVGGSMRLFEPDGKEAAMCGNGIRCVADYLMKKLGKSEVYILTRDGVKHVTRTPEGYRIEVGPVRTRRADLEEYVSDKGAASNTVLNLSVRAGERILRGSLVNSGEPHLVIRSADVAVEDVRGLGEVLNRDRGHFPKGINLDFVQIIGPHEIRVRTYERGVYDETLACGTGATASAAVARFLGWVEVGPITVTTLGGVIKIEVAEDGTACMTGPAVPVFEGRLIIDI